MKQRSIFGVLVLVVVVALTQCTVQKRLYRKGYYISFNRTPKISNPPSEKRQLNDRLAQDTAVSSNENEIQPIVRSSDTPASSTTKTVEDQDHATSTQRTPVTSLTANVIKAKENVKSTVKQVVLAKQKPKELKRPKRTAIALITSSLIIVSLFTIFFGLSSSGPLLLIAAFVVFLGAVIALFVGLSREYEQHKRNVLNQNPDTKKPELSASDWKRLNQKRLKIAVGVTIALTVIFFCLLIVWLSSTVINSGFFLFVIGALFLFFIGLAWSRYEPKKPETNS